MHVRRSLLAFLIGGIVLLSLSLILWRRSGYITVFPWAGSGWTAGEHSDLGIADGPLDLGHAWPDPKPGDDSLRKSPQGVDESNDTPSHIQLSSPVLRQRLQSLLDAPALSHVETVAKNEEACPRDVADMQVNKDQLRENREKWLAVSISDIRRRRQAIVRHLEQLEKEGKSVMGSGSGAGEGRGVVMTAGNKVMCLLDV
ncbi:hypothetical protein JB92DRAFT_2982225 [Gautieria morchelliformis]|nr:hypothetical protein JB92DRAFT_2982225 [Gautieria morchelliformis]